MNNEIDYLMTLTSTGLRTYDTPLEAKAAMLKEWIDTPMGSIYGLPGWGNILSEFKHDPIGSDHVQVAIESKLLQKLAEDLPSLKINGISLTGENSTLPLYLFAFPRELSARSIKLMATLDLSSIKDKLNKLIAGNSWWSQFAGSQFVNMLATLIWQMVYRCLQFASASLAEGFISTATKRASIPGGFRRQKLCWYASNSQ